MSNPPAPMGNDASRRETTLDQSRRQRTLRVRHNVSRRSGAQTCGSLCERISSPPIRANMQKILLLSVMCGLLFVPNAEAFLGSLAEIRSSTPPQDLDVCTGSTTPVTCSIVVKVKNKGNKNRKCEVKIDRPVLLVSWSTGSVNIEWSLEVTPSSDNENYKFDLKNGIDFSGDDNDDEFGAGTATPPSGNVGAKYNVPHSKKTKKKAFNYTVQVLRKIDTNWVVCGIYDPIIVNRD